MVVGGAIQLRQNIDVFEHLPSRDLYLTLAVNLIIIPDQDTIHHYWETSR